MQYQKTRNPADFPVLGFLCNGPSHGYDLCRELRDRLGEVWTLRTSHIYALLAGLEKDGLVRHDRVEQDCRPAKKVYSITVAGRQVFLEWVRSPVENVRDVRLEFLAKLYFAFHGSPSGAADLISDQLRVCLRSEKLLREKRRICKTATEQVVLDYRMAMVEATVTWLTRLRAPDKVKREEAALGG